MKIKVATPAQQHMTIAMAKALPVNNNPTREELKDPMAICKAPINAEALPAPFSIGRNATVAMLGKIRPWQASIKNKRKINEYMFNKSK